MAMLNLIPPLLAETVYFDNVYYIILFMMLSFIGIALPFIFTLPKYLTAISHILGGWFIAGFAFELMNLQTPEIVLNDASNPVIYTKAVLCFMVSITFIMIKFTWKKNS
jgi:hypothetical protein